MWLSWCKLAQLSEYDERRDVNPIQMKAGTTLVHSSVCLKLDILAIVALVESAELLLASRDIKPTFFGVSNGFVYGFSHTKAQARGG